MKYGFKTRRYFFFLLFLLGGGVYAQSISGVINSYFKVTDFIPAYNGVRVQNVSGLNSGTRVLLIQMKGATINLADNSSFGSITNLSTAGLYEFATICGFLNDTVIFEKELINSYNFLQDVQLVTIPQYTNVTVNGLITAQPWNPTTGTGGIIALDVSETLTLQANISANGAGFRGGQLLSFPNCQWFVSSPAYFYNPSGVITNNANGTYKGEGINVSTTNYEGGKGKQSNGGGGGNNHNAGGGGGANFGTGGSGGNYTGSGTFSCSGPNSGIGGTSLTGFGYSPLQNRIFLGGGGGAGHDNNGQGTPGGNGGGIVFISCYTLEGNGFSISANGSQGVNPVNSPSTEASGDGGGGGGGGGVILLQAVNYSGPVTLSANGAAGSLAGFQAQCPGPGGGGGGGVIWSALALPGTVTTNVSGGATGYIKDSPNNPACELTANGASAGTGGLLQTGFLIPEGAVFNCSGLLASPLIANWKGVRVNTKIEFSWDFDFTADIISWYLQKSIHGENFKTIQVSGEYIQKSNRLMIEADQFPVLYRLQAVLRNNTKLYSSIFSFHSNVLQRITLYPNPANRELQFRLPVTETGSCEIRITDIQGRQIQEMNQWAVIREGVYSVPLSPIPAGIYFLTLRFQNKTYQGKFIKQ